MYGLRNRYCRIDDLSSGPKVAALDSEVMALQALTVEIMASDYKVSIVRRLASEIAKKKGLALDSIGLEYKTSLSTTLEGLA